MVNLGGSQLFSPMVFLDDFGTHEKRVEKHWFKLTNASSLRFVGHVSLVNHQI